MALLLLLLATAEATSLGDIVRRDTGDVFTLTGEKCGAAQCAEHGAGSTSELQTNGCTCSCPQRAPLFREDRELCVDDLPECSLATFGTGIGVQRIPFIYLPLKGQIIHPSREITFQNVKTPICAVSGAQFLTRKGFLDLRNTLDADVPFSLIRDEGRTFLQWSGEDDVRKRMSGRVMVVRLLCRDVAATPSSPMDLRGVFTPCVAFRVQGSPPRHTSNVTEVQFAPNAQTSEASNSSGLTITEYVAIGISSLLLGLVYVASVFLYLHIRKRRKIASEEDTVRRIKKIKKKDGTAITERDIIRINNERIQALPSIGQDDGVIKKNPLLSVGRQFNENKSNFTSDSGSGMSDSEDFADSSARSEENCCKNMTTSAIVHLRNGDLRHQNDTLEVNHRDESNIERLPDEHVSIVETIDDREIARPVGTTRRKLYFNPAYFEPHLLADPPAAALEFLSKIREVIAIAKHKMASKRFQPVLNQIPEEETYPSNGTSLDIYQGLGSQRSGSAISLKRENSRKKSVNCLGCPGCQSDSSNDIQNVVRYNIPICSNCLNTKGDKQNSIREWLEKIPIGKQQLFQNEFLQNTNQQTLANSLLSLPDNQCKINKQNSLTTSNSMYLPDNVIATKRTLTRSVKSEPAMRNYNIPLPDFEKSSNEDNFNCCQTVTRVDDIRPIGLRESRSGSLRSFHGFKANRKTKMLCNKSTLPDMVNDTIALDNFSKSYTPSSSDEEKFTNYTEESRKNNACIRPQTESPSCNEYETDSLERASNKKEMLTPADYPDVPSSQASPSLSNALPLEEELTMRNAIYKTNSSSNSNTPSPHRDICIEQNHYETIEIKKNVTKEGTAVDNKGNQNREYSLVSEVYVNNNYNFGSTPTSPSGSECSMGSRKLIEVNGELKEKPGCLTIEVKDPPENYIKIHESDGFEPDTLDRKHPKHKEILESIQFSRKDILKNINNNGNQNNQRIQLRSSGTFKKSESKGDYVRKFNSLRNDHSQHKNIQNYPKLSSNTFNESKIMEDSSDVMWENDASWTSEEGRILTLELRHSKRQRQCTPPTVKEIKCLARPDILPPLPPTDSQIYENPINPPRRVESQSEIHSKNVSGRSLSLRTQAINHNLPGKSNESSCSPMSASVLRDSIYEDLDIVIHKDDKHNEKCRKSIKNVPDQSNINTNTFVIGQKIDGQHKTKLKRKKVSSIEDSGYLSSDSTSSRKFQKKLVIARIVSCSDSDDTENEARSESGAESIETHSVYFGSFRKLHPNVEKCMNNISGIRDSNRIRKKVVKNSENS